MENEMRRRSKPASRKAQISHAISTRDLTALKQLARTKGGLETTRLRRQAWPLLLNFRSLTDSAHNRSVQHHEESQVSLDIPRINIPQSPEFLRTKQADSRRQRQLTHVVCSVLRSYPWLSYYQGFHELSLVFLLVFGSERPAAEAVRMVALFFVRDAMASNLDHVLQQLQLLYVLLKAISPQVHAILADLDVPPFFAISWVLTWFSHDLSSFADICRIYDFLLVSPPLQVVYMAAVMIKQREGDILALERDFASLHTALIKLPAQVNAWQPIIDDSGYLLSEYPPTKLQLMGNCRLPKLSAVNTFEQSWKRLDPARPLQFPSLVPVKDRHPLATASSKSTTADDNRMAQVIELTSTAQKARDLAVQYRWPLVVATAASVTMLMYAWLLMNQFQQLYP
ncbi:GTPase-activating protein gyp8 [Coemansia sp. RSA 1290]|nr:GTPase-activating protein gyp8 [Coemansia sp. RSA 1290]KAJ2651117.1 GTPase-activating protein gyp8 [Coemansia sp. RSA 1250]